MPTKKITKLNPKGTLISRVVVVKGTPGKDGKTPIAGEDYKIPDRGEDGYTPIKGVDYFDGEDGYTPTTDDLLALILPNIPNPIPGKDGKDGIDGENVPEEKIYEMVEKVVGTIEVPTIEIGEDRNGQWIEKDGKKTYIKSVTNIGAGMSTGVVDFIALRDTPSSYAGQAGKFAKVKADETGLEFAAGGGGGGAVDSVNGQTGVVVLDTGDIAEATDANYVSDAQLVVIGNTSGTNTGDQTNITGNAGTVTTINGRITAGANVTITGSGTAASPYSIAASGGGGGSPGGSDTQIQFNDGGTFGGTVVQYTENYLGAGLNALLTPDSATPETLIVASASGSSGNADGALAGITAGNGNGSGNGGAVVVGAIEGATMNGGATGNGGAVYVLAGLGGSTSGNGGDIYLTTGTATSGNGGTVIISSQLGADGGDDGNITLITGRDSGVNIQGTDGNAYFQTEQLTDARGYSFPDVDGTFHVGVFGSFSQVGTATTAFTVTIGTTQLNSTYNVQITPTASLAAALFYISAKTTTTFTVTYLTGLTGTVTFDWLLTA